MNLGTPYKMLCIHHFYDYTKITKKKKNNRRITGHRIIKVGRHHRRSLVQPPTQSKVSYEAWTDSPELYPVGSWKFPRTETAQTLWVSCSNVWLPSWGEFFSLYSVWTTVSMYSLCVSCPPTIYCCEECGLSSQWPPHRHGRGAAPRSPKAFPSPS